MGLCTTHATSYEILEFKDFGMPINVCLINLVKMDYKTKTSSYLVLQGLAICG